MDNDQLTLEHPMSALPVLTSGLAEDETWWCFSRLLNLLTRQPDAEHLTRTLLDHLPQLLPLTLCAVSLLAHEPSDHWWTAGYLNGHSLSARQLDFVGDLCRHYMKQVETEAFQFAEPSHVRQISAGEWRLAELNPGPLLAAPIGTERDRYGVLLIGKPAGAIYSWREQLLVDLVSNHLARLLESAKLRRESANRERELALVYQTGQRITQLLDLSELMAQLVEAVSETFGHESVTLLLHDDITGDLVVRETYGLRKDRHIGYRIPVTTARTGGIVGWVAHEGRTMLVTDVRTCDRYIQTVRETRSELAVPLKIKDRVIGVLDIQNTAVDGITAKDRHIIETLAGQVAVALENARLYHDLARANAEVRQKAQQLQKLLERTVKIQEQERQRIAADIHDDVNQWLYAALYEVAAMLTALPAGSDATAQQLRSIQHSLDIAIGEMRKAIFDLWPTSLDEMGLLQSIQSSLSKLEKSTGLRCKLTVKGTPVPFSPLARISLYRIAQEGLHNVQRHAHANSVAVRFSFNATRVRLKIQDDGRGFPFDEREAAGGEHLGLISMEERARSLGGQMQIRSSADDGTTLAFDFPRERLTRA